MKINSISLRTFVLACLFSAPFISGSLVHAYDEALIARLITEFLDVQNCKKSFRQFAEEFRHALSGNNSYSSFVDSLNKIKNSNNANIIALTLTRHKRQMPAFMGSMLNNKNSNELMDIIKKRISL